jgi:hypothetical protein
MAAPDTLIAVQADPVPFTALNQDDVESLLLMGLVRVTSSGMVIATQQGIVAWQELLAARQHLP